jgi:hypothetical protein
MQCLLSIFSRRSPGSVKKEVGLGRGIYTFKGPRYAVLVSDVP